MLLVSGNAKLKLRKVLSLREKTIHQPGFIAFNFDLRFEKIHDQKNLKLFSFIYGTYQLVLLFITITSISLLCLCVKIQNS